MAPTALTAVAPRESTWAIRLPWLMTSVVGSSVLLLLALSLPAFWGHVYVADDLGGFHLSARAFYAEALSRGESIHWWPQLFGGFYLTGEGQAGTLHPLHWVLYRWLPLSTALNLEVVLSYPWMLLGMYCWLRRRLPRADAAFFGALLFTFCGFNLLHLPHVNAVAVLAQLPCLLWAIDVVICDCRPRWRLAATAAIPLLTASQLLLGYPQYVWFSVLVEAAYAWWLLRDGPPLWLVVQRGRHTSRRGSGTMVEIWLTLAAAVGIGFLLGGIQLWPTYDALADSMRREAGIEFAEFGSLHPWNLMQLLGPYLFSTRVVGQNTHELGLYAGCVPLMLCAWLWIRRRELGALRGLIAAATVVAVCALWLALGEYGYLYRLQTYLPVVGKFRFPCRAISIFHLAVAVLSASALALLATRQPARLPLAAGRYALLWGLAGASFALAVLGWVVLSEHVASLPLVVVGPVLVLVAAVLVWLADRNVSAALPALVVLAAIDLGAYGLSYSVYGQTEPLATFASQWPAPPPDAAAARLMADAPSAGTGELCEGNQPLLAGWHRADGYAGLPPQKRLDYRAAKARRVAGIGCLGCGAAASLSEHAAPPEPQAGVTQPPCVVETAETPLPAVRLVGTVQPSVHPAYDLETIDTQRTALVEPGLETWRALAGNPVGVAAIQRQSPGRLEVSTSAAATNLLVTNQSWHRGWRATIDGQPAAAERIYGDFVGCVVPAGKHRVELKFQPDSLRHGALLSAGGLAGLVLGMAWLVRRQREGR